MKKLRGLNGHSIKEFWTSFSFYFFCHITACNCYDFIAAPFAPIRKTARLAFRGNPLLNLRYWWTHTLLKPHPLDSNSKSLFPSLVAPILLFVKDNQYLYSFYLTFKHFSSQILGDRSQNESNDLSAEPHNERYSRRRRRKNGKRKNRNRKKNRNSGNSGTGSGSRRKHFKPFWDDDDDDHYDYDEYDRDSGYSAPSSGYEAPSTSYNEPSSGYGAPSYEAPSRQDTYTLFLPLAPFWEVHELKILQS